MLRTKDLVIDAERTLGTHLIAVGMRDHKKFVNGIRTDTIDGVVIDIVMADKGYQRASVVVPTEGVQIDESAIASNAQVRFQGLTVRVYVIDGRPLVSARADSVTTFSDKKATG